MKVKPFKPLGNKVKTRKPKLTKTAKIDKLIKQAFFATK
jgi:hypothetical protein